MTATSERYMGRVYEQHELGGDGYPSEWHSLFDAWPGVGIKHVVRLEAGNRCVRCQHPYASGTGEWSPCDGQCEHDGPVRWRSRLLADVGSDWGIDSTSRSVRDFFVPGTNGAYEVEARWRILTVHHLDGDKANCRWWNLVALCQRCHLQVQGKVRMERRWLHEHSPWFRPYVAGYYALTYGGVELSRDEVEARMDELLALEERQLTLGGPA